MRDKMRWAVRIIWWIVAIVLAVMLVTVWFPGPPSQGAVAGRHDVVRRTCTPGRTFLIGYWRARDNAFAGPSSRRFCVTVTERPGGAPQTLTVGSNAVAYNGRVVADPGLWFGPAWTLADPSSGLPERIGEMGGLTFHVRCAGRTVAQLLCDLDAYFGPSPAWLRTKHATAELVIANRWSDTVAPGARASILGPAAGQIVSATSAGNWQAARIGGRRYWFAHWITSDPKTGFTWPLMEFRQASASVTARVRPAAFVSWLRRHGLWPKHAGWYGSSQYVAELWSGGRGLRISARVTGMLPVLRALG